MGDTFDGVVDFFLNGFHECNALLVEFAFWTEVFLFEVGGFLLLGYDGLFALFLLGFGEEHGLVLVVFVKGLGLVVEGFDLVLPAAGDLVELFVGALVGGNIAENVFHVDEGEFLCRGCEAECAQQQGEG